MAAGAALQGGAATSTRDGDLRAASDVRSSLQEPRAAAEKARAALAEATTAAGLALQGRAESSTLDWDTSAASGVRSSLQESRAAAEKVHASLAEDTRAVGAALRASQHLQQMRAEADAEANEAR